MGKKNHTPNDQRSMAKNPNNPAFHANQDNHSNQLNPKHLTFHLSRQQENKNQKRK